MPTTKEMTAIIRGAQAVQQVRRKLNLDEGVPSFASSPAPLINRQLGTRELQTLDAGGANFAQPSFSPELSQALVLSHLGMSPKTANIQVVVQESGAFVGLDSAVGPPTSNPSTEDLAREQAFVSIGDRLEGRTNTPPDTNTQSFEFSETYPAPALIHFDTYELKQDDLTFLRDAVAGYVDRQIRFYPSISEEDLITSVDSVFGEGLSEIFHLRQVDKGAGLSEVHLNQVDLSSIVSSDDKDLLISAFSYASESFKTGKHDPVYIGEDVSQAVEGIRVTLGIDGAAVVAQLEGSLKSGKNVKENFEAVSQFMEDFGVDANTQNQVRYMLGQISSVATKANAAFAKDPFFDEFKHSYQSGRYALAGTSEDIEESAELTPMEWDFQTFKV